MIFLLLSIRLNNFHIHPLLPPCHMHSLPKSILLITKPASTIHIHRNISLVHSLVYSHPPSILNLHPFSIPITHRFCLNTPRPIVPNIDLLTRHFSLLTPHPN